MSDIGRVRSRLQGSMRKRQSGEKPESPPEQEIVLRPARNEPNDDIDSDPDLVFTRLKSRVPAPAAYRAFFPGKKIIKRGGAIALGQCPNREAHPRGDIHPQLQLYDGDRGFFCHACGITGSVIDLAAIAYGDADGSYKCPQHKAGEVAARATYDLLGIEMERYGDGLWRDVPPEHGDPLLERWAAETTEIGPDFGKPDLLSSDNPVKDFQPDVTSTNGNHAREPEADDPEPEPAPALSSISKSDFFTERASVTTREAHPGSDLDYAFSKQDDLLHSGALFVPLTERPLRENDLVPPTLKPLDVLPESSTFLRPYLEFTRCHFGSPEWHFFSALMAVGMAMGKNAYSNGVPVYGNLMVCLVGRVAGGKSSSFEVCSRIIERALFVDNQDEFSEGVRIVSNAASGPSLIDAFRHRVVRTEPVPDRSQPPNSDGTYPPKTDTQGNVITAEVEHVGDRVRVLAEYSELSTLKAKASAEASTLQQTLMDAYDGNKVANRTRGHGEEVVRDPFCSVMTTTQPDMLRKLISQDAIASGFASRIVFVLGRDRIPNSEDEQNYYAPPDYLVGALRGIDRFCRGLSDKRIRFDNDQTRRLWDGIFSQELYGMRDRAGSRTLEYLAARNIPLFRKIMLIIAVDSRSSVITTDVLLRTLAIWRYVENCMEVVSGEAGQDSITYSDIEQEIIHYIREFKNESEKLPTRRELRRKFHRQDTEMVTKSLRNLLEAGEVVEIESAKRRGQPTKYLDLVT